MKEKTAQPTPAESNKHWQKTQYSNLIRYVPSGTYYARLRVKGKLIRRSLKTDVLSVAKLRLSDFEKAERKGAENRDSVSAGRMNLAAAIAIHKKRMAGDGSLKPSTKVYHDERIAALLKSWPNLATKEMRTVTKTDCLDWAAKFGTGRSATVFNHTISILRKLFEIGIEMGARYDNPARFIKRVSERPKRLTLPEPETFTKFVAEVENGGSGFSRRCANLIRFLAYGGFRKNEAANITWADCDFEKSEIVVRGDPEDGTGVFVIVRNEIALQPGLATWEAFHDPKDGKVKLDGDNVVEFPKLPDFQPVTLKVLRWEEKDKRFVIKDAELVV